MPRISWSNNTKSKIRPPSCGHVSHGDYRDSLQMRNEKKRVIVGATVWRAPESCRKPCGTQLLHQIRATRKPPQNMRQPLCETQMSAIEMFHCPSNGRRQTELRTPLPLVCCTR